VAEPFDPIAIARALHDQRVSFVLIGDMAEVANGSPLGFSEVEVTYSLKDENVERLASTLGEITDGSETPGVPRDAETTLVATRFGPLRLTPTPPGTRGYDDVRRKAHREHVARGLRIEIADVRDLVRIENAGDADRVRTATLQRIELHVSRDLGIDL
jgi:hypothetical protein